MRRMRACNCRGIGGRPGRDFNRQNDCHPARCQRFKVSALTTTSASCHSKNRESNARETRVTGSTRRGLAPRSMYWASCRRRNRISATRDLRGQIDNRTHSIRSATSRTPTDRKLSAHRSCHIHGDGPIQEARTAFVADHYAFTHTQYLRKGLQFFTNWLTPIFRGSCPYRCH